MISKFVNLMGISLKIYMDGPNNSLTIFPSPGRTASVQYYPPRIEPIKYMDHKVLVFSDECYIVGLPPTEDGVCYIVDGEVRKALPHRKDLYSPRIVHSIARGYHCVGLVGNFHVANS